MKAPDLQQPANASASGPTPQCAVDGVDQRDHNEGESPLPEDLVQRLLLDALPIDPPAERVRALKARILERVSAMTQETAPQQQSANELTIHYENTITIRADVGQWVEIVPRVHLKRLHRDGDARTYLLRLEPGGVIPRHHHDSDEECMVMEGEVFLGDLRVAAGDYHLAPRGATHGEIRSPNGALLFIRSATGIAYSTRPG